MDIAFAGFSLKVRERLLSGPGGPVEIGARAIDVLHVLLARPNEVVSKDELLTAVWPGSIVEENALQAQISALRKSLGPSMIVTIHGRGYRYAGPPPRPMGGDLQAIEREDRKPVVAVLPFTNLSADPDQQYFSDGITEDIIDRLSRFRNLAVIGSHTTFALRAAGTSLSGMRERLTADYLVTGNVRRSGDHIRIAARLADAARDTVLWAEHYDRPVEEILGIHDELAGIIASMLSRHVEVDIASRPPIRDVTSYELVLKGMMHFRILSAENQETAAIYFRRALESNPRSAEACRGLSAYHIAQWLMLHSPQDIHQALSLAQRGIELDPANADCHSNLGLALLWVDGVDAAAPAFQRAMELNPGDSYVLADASVYAAYGGRLDKSRELLNRACQLNPIAPQWFSEYRGLLNFADGRYAEAVQDFTGLVEGMYNLTYQVSCLGHMGDSVALRTVLPRVRSRGWDLQPVVDGEPFCDPTLRDRLSEGIAKAWALSKD